MELGTPIDSSEVDGILQAVWSGDCVSVGGDAWTGGLLGDEGKMVLDGEGVKAVMVSKCGGTITWISSDCGAGVARVDEVSDWSMTE